MYKAVFIDMDGTLLRADHTISEATIKCIQHLVRNNIMVVLVSARPYHGITAYSAQLGTLSLPVASLNGAYIRLIDEVIFESSIDLETIRGLHKQATEAGVTLIYYTGLEWWAETTNNITQKEQRITDVGVTIAPFDALMQDWHGRQTSPNKVLAVGEEKVIALLESNLLSDFSGRLNIYTSKSTYLEIMRLDASKTKAIRFIIQRYGIMREEILALGDNFNDKEMIAFAGTGVAMGNAPDAVKAVADYVTDTNEHDGVRKAIEKFIPM
ncbi:MAG: Cof-type HAD-IIB family hydrolase [Chitinophagaceae bacterium]